MTLKALPFVILTGFLFGSTLIASRFSVGQFHPLIYISLRLIIASSVFLLIYTFMPGKKFPTNRQHWIRAGLFGVFGTAVNLVGIVSALQYLSSGLTSVLFTVAPALTAMLAHFLLPVERLSMRQWVGVMLSLSGALLLTLAGENGLPETSTDPRGYLLVAIAMFFGSTMTIYARKALTEYDAFDTAGIRMFTAAMAVIPLTLIFADFDLSAVNEQGIFAVVYAALLGTFGGFMVQLYVIKRFGAIPASMVPFIIPVVSVSGGILILDETLTPIMIVAVVIILSGIALVQRRKAKIKIID
ncbi:MAG: DMT family transporter [Aggregatilineales bacterium]